MIADTTAALLKPVALLNSDPDTGCTCELAELPRKGEVLDALASAFDPGVNWRTNTPYGAEDWHLRVSPRGNDIWASLSEVLGEWACFMTCSPKQASTQDWAANTVTEMLCQALIDTIGPSEIYDVLVFPPVWYEAHWQDLAFKGEGRSWLLHLGVSDCPPAQGCMHGPPRYQGASRCCRRMLRPGRLGSRHTACGNVREGR